VGRIWLGGVGVGVVVVWGDTGLEGGIDSTLFVQWVRVVFDAVF
jgi:hypothetical protein